ncbi:MAG TPA: glycosyltransferase [Burkholderiales bacterium]|nr:glycosyltransferase [Burkholderiales bacterium]
MRKVAIISEHASPLAVAGGIDSGGQNIYVAHVAQQLARLGCVVDVFTRRDHILQPSIVKWKNRVRVVHVPAGPTAFVAKEDLLPYMRDFGDGMLKFCSSQRQTYDVVHANFFLSGLAAQAMVKALGIPLIMTFHALGRVRRLFQQEADRFPSERADIEDRLMCDADRIIAECPQDLYDMLSLYRARSRKIDVVPCGFDPDEFQPVARSAARAKLGWDENEFAILQLGRMVARKGVDNVIRALASLRDDHGMRARLYVVGGNSDEPNEVATPEIGRLRRIAHEEGVASQVTFVGRRRRAWLRFFYSAADVFVTTPWYEPFGITPVEAMACGVPVIGAAVGGIKHTVRDGETGFLVPPRDPAALACRLARLHDDRALARRMGQAACRRANKLFTWRSVGLDIAGVYERAMARVREANPLPARAAM